MASPQNPPVKHRRTPMRHPSYDYTSPGHYAITSCTRHRVPYFQDPFIHKTLEETWHGLPERFPAIELDEFVIMPDHVHFIIQITDANEGKHCLGDILQAFKSISVVKWMQHMHALGHGKMYSFWQPDYYDHIVRCDDDLDEQRAYIHNNPIKKALQDQGILP